MKYTLETLKEHNVRYMHEHFLNEDDVKKANVTVEHIEKTRSKETPKAGDVIEFCDEFGEYFGFAHIETIEDDGNAYVCERAYVPFIDIVDSGITCCASGGAWKHIPVKEMEYVENVNKRFCYWGCSFPSADGAIEVVANVSKWRWTEGKSRFEKDGISYDTRNYECYHIVYKKDPDDLGYTFFASRNASNSNAWKSERELQAWLHTNKAEIFGNFVWTWKTETHHVSPDEYEAINAEEDVLLHNGSKMRCKRIYEEENHKIHLYYVWYWDIEGKDFYESASECNRIRKEKYELDWKRETNELTIRKLENGILKPYDIKSIKARY